MNTTNEQLKKNDQPFSIKEKPGEYNDHEEPVEEKSDKIYNQTKPEIDTPLPEPEKAKKKIPHLRKGS